MTVENTINRVSYSYNSRQITQEMDSHDFLRLLSKNSSSIKRSRVIIPKIGTGGKIKFLVEFEGGR